MVIAILLIVMGLIFLASNLGWLPADVWGTFWPIVLIVIGISLLTKKGRRSCWCCRTKDMDQEK